MLEKQISILGCGHLGKTLIKRLLNQTITPAIKAATKSSIIEQNGVNHYFIDIDSPKSQAWKNFFDSPVLVIALPPSSSVHYSNLAKLIEPYIDKKIHIILISSVGAYANDQGDVDEQTLPAGKSSLIEIEKNFHQIFPKTTILRLGGIVSPKRQIWNYLEGRTVQFDEYLHLVDIENCVDAILSTATNDHTTRGQIYNIVNSQRELKSSFYARKCKTPPHFIQMRESAKNISNKKSIRELNVNYKTI